MCNKKRFFHIANTLIYALFTMAFISCQDPASDPQPKSNKPTNTESQFSTEPNDDTTTSNTNTNDTMPNDDTTSSSTNTNDDDVTSPNVLFPEMKNTKIITVSAGDYHSAAITNDGILYTWGRNNYGQLGLGNNIDKNTPQKGNVNSSTGWKALSTGHNHAVAITADGKLYAWGANESGQLGFGISDNSLYTIPSKIFTTEQWQSVSARSSHTLAITADRKLYAWGANNYGQLGLGHTAIQSVPTLVNAEGVNNWKSVATGHAHTVAITTDGKLYVWGANNHGQLGFGIHNDTSSYTTPMQISATEQWQSVSTRLSHTAAITSDGKLYVWGANNYGQLGLGHTAIQNIPITVNVEGVNAWKTASAGYSHTMAITSDGKLYGWGDNDYGQLGLGKEGDNQNTPQQIGDKTYWKSVSAGNDFTLALTDEGKLFVWGQNNYEQLGLGDDTVRNIPTPVPMGFFNTK